MGATTVADLMTEPVLTVRPDDNAADVGHAMADRGIKSVVIIDDDCHPEGIVTSTDFVAMAADDRTPSETAVREYMTTGIVTATREEPVPEVAERMRAEDINHLPVVDDDGQVLGILTATDLTASLSEAAARAD
ncbi:MAG: CBS domain-containing protein [Halorientalis sp.]